MPTSIKHWTNFLKVAQAGSLSRVANELGIAQPILSRQIRFLEGEFGVALFERNGRGMRLTQAGEQFRKRADMILDQISHIREELTATRDQPSGALSFALPPSMTTTLAGPLISAYALRYRFVHLRVHEMALAALRPAILSGEVELGIGVLPLSDPELSVDPLLAEPMHVVGSAALRLHRNAVMTLAQIAQFPLLLPKRPNGFRLIFETMLEREGLTPHIVMEADFASTIECVARGLGCCIVPSCALANPALGTRVSASRIKGVTVRWGVIHLKKRSLSPAASCLKADVMALARQLVTAKQWKAELLCT